MRIELWVKNYIGMRKQLQPPEELGYQFSAKVYGCSINILHGSKHCRQLSYEKLQENKTLRDYSKNLRHK